MRPDEPNPSPTAVVIDLPLGRVERVPAGLGYKVVRVVRAVHHMDLLDLC